MSEESTTVASEGIEKLANLQTKETDEELAKKSVTDRSAFDELINRYEQKLRRYVSRMILSSPNKDEDEIDDILQDTFIKTYKNIADFDTSLSFSSWIYRIARNETISVLRKHKRFFFFERESKDTDDGEIFGTDHLEYFNVPPNQAEDFDESINKEQIKKVLSFMDQKYRDILVLRYFEEKDYTEISDILKKPPGTVATLLRRAKVQFEKISKEKSKLHTISI